jgi:hypothetical protein
VLKGGLGSDAYGGAIYNNGRLSVNSSTLTGNGVFGSSSSVGGTTPYGTSAGYPAGAGQGAACTTPTTALLPGSPAIHAGDNASAPVYDQRGPGFARIVGGTIDIGAFEVQPASQVTHYSVSTPATAVAGSAFAVTVKAVNDSGNAVTSYTGTVHFSSSDGQTVLPSDYTFTSGDAGVHTFSATLKTAGTQTISVRDSVTAGLGGGQGASSLTRRRRGSSSSAPRP